MGGTDTDGTGTGSSSGAGDVDLPVFDMLIDPDVCKVVDDMNGTIPCIDKAPPDSFDPKTQWEWTGPNDEHSVIVTPLVANLTDDDGNGTIDLCDTADVVIVAYTKDDVLTESAHLYVLDGGSGSQHFRAPTNLSPLSTPAIGDIDGDGLPEIVAQDGTNHVVALDHDGAFKWASDEVAAVTTSLALADMDNDGDVEILVDNAVFDHLGNLIFMAPVTPPINSATVAADLDGDGDLEMLLGNAAYHHDGSVYFEQPGVDPGYPQVGDMDGDGDPEIVVDNTNGITLLEHDGAIVYQDLRPTGDPADSLLTWYRPSTIHDFDGDGEPEFAVSSKNHYAAYEADASILWSANVLDASGAAAGTAFDFLGDGVAEAMYADEKTMYVFDGSGQPLLATPRSSRTGNEYPVVADVDNDGSAEIVVVANGRTSQGQYEPPNFSVQVVRDKEDRWIPARRIWNQHTYHVTNIREDGIIPQFEPPHWKLLNTFRTQAQLTEGGIVCKPEG